MTDQVDEPRWNSRYQAFYEEGRESGLDVTEAGRYADRRTTEELGADPAVTVDPEGHQPDSLKLHFEIWHAMQRVHCGQVQEEWLDDWARAVNAEVVQPALNDVRKRMALAEAALEPNRNALVDLAEARRLLRERNRAYGRASATIGELRGQLARRDYLPGAAGERLRQASHHISYWQSLYTKTRAELEKLRAELQRERESRQAWQEKLAEHEFKLSDALGIVGAEEGIDPYGAVVALHTEIDRLSAELDAVKAKADSDRLWKEAIDWLLNSRHTADPDIQSAFWGMVEGRFTREQADTGVFKYDAEGNASIPTEDEQSDTEPTEQASKPSPYRYAWPDKPCEKCGSDACDCGEDPEFLGHAEQAPREPRVWSVSDVEPAGVTAVVTAGGAAFYRSDDRRWRSDSVMHGYAFTWSDLVNGYPFVTEVIEDGTQ